MRSLLITRPQPDPVVDAARAFMEVTVRSSTAPLSDEELRDSLRSYDAIMPTLGDQFSEQVFYEVMEPKCKILANFGVGYNHIDTIAASRRAITVTNTPGAVTDATADIAMALILMSARRLGEGERLVRAGKWEGWNPMQMLGMHVTGRTVGIIGMGVRGSQLVMNIPPSGRVTAICEEANRPESTQPSARA